MNPNDEVKAVVEIAAAHEGPRKDPAQMMRELVEREVAEILHKRDAFIFEPFFRTKKVADEIRRLQTIPEWKRWGRRFIKYGCLDCKTRDANHVGCVLCEKCYRRTKAQLLAGDREDRSSYQQEQVFIDQEDIARHALVGDVEAFAALPAPHVGNMVYRTQGRPRPRRVSIPQRCADGFGMEKSSHQRARVWSGEDILQLQLLRAKKRSDHGGKASRARWDKVAEKTEVRALQGAVVAAQEALAPPVVSHDGKRPRYRTHTEAAREAGVNPLTVYSWIEDGKIQRPATGIGKRRLWTDEDIDRLKKFTASEHDSRRGPRHRTHAEAAREAGVNRDTLYSWIKDGKVQRPGTKIGKRRWLWTDDDIERLKAFAGKRGAKTQPYQQP